MQQRRRQWHPTPVLLPGKSRGRRSLVGCSPWRHEESDMTEWLHFHFSLLCIGEGNGNPLQRSCLENPRDGVTQSQTWLKWLSSSSSNATDHYGSCHLDCHSRLTTLYWSYLVYFWLLSIAMWSQNLSSLIDSGELLHRSSFHCQVQTIENRNYFWIIQRYQILSYKYILYCLSEGLSFVSFQRK